MASVFVLQHVHTLEDGTEEVKFIGKRPQEAAPAAAA